MPEYYKLNKYNVNARLGNFEDSVTATHIEMWPVKN